MTLDGTIWQDATGTVWQTSEIYGWSGTVIDLSTSAARPIIFNYAGKIDTFYTPNADYWSAGGGTNLYFATAMYETWALWFTNTYYGAESNSNWIADGTPPPSLSATNITISTSNEYYRLYYRPVALSTNPVDHVLYASASGDAATADRALSIGTPTRWTDATGCVWEVQTTRVCTNANEVWTYSVDGVTYTEEQMVDAIGGGESEYSQTLVWMNSTFIGKDGEEEFEGWFVIDGSGSHPIGYSYTTGDIPESSADHFLALAEYVGYDYSGYRDVTIRAFRGTEVSGTNLVGRVALTNDLPGAITSTISDFAATGTVHAAESSTYSSRLFDSSYDSSYDATYLIRESTNAATAVSSSLVRYSLVTPGVWESGDIDSYGIPSWHDGKWYLDGAGILAEEPENINSNALRLVFIDGGTELVYSRDSLPGKLIDRAVNDITIASPTNITLPALSYPGQARDFILLLDIPSSVTNTVPGLTGLLTFTPSGTETVHYYVDGDDPSTAEFPVPTSPGTWSYSFSEFKASWFAISLKQIVEAVPPSQSNGGAQ